LAWKSSSRPSTSASSKEKLPYSSVDHEDLPSHSASSIPDINKSRNKKSPLTNCRFRAVRLPKLPAIVRTAQNKAVTTRAVNNNVNNIISKPFIRSDPDNPLRGITITVHRQQVVSEPTPEFSSPSTTSLLSSVSALSLDLDKPLPTPAQDLTRDLPAIPAPDDDHLEDEDPRAVVSVDVPPASESEAKSLISSVTTPATLHVPHQRKRRKRYTTHPVPASA
jgi:hypothetical protein